MTEKCKKIPTAVICVHKAAVWLDVFQTSASSVPTPVPLYGSLAGTRNIHFKTKNLCQHTGWVLQNKDLFSNNVF